MKRPISMIIAGIAGALIVLLGLGIVSTTFAQGPSGQAAQPARSASGGRQMGRGQAAGPTESLVGMAAAELGITQADLVAQLGADGTIADALSNGGIDPAGFIDRFVASRAERLDAAVAAGTLTRTEADARLATARSMATARIYQPFTVLGSGGQGPDQGRGQRNGSGDANGDGVCDMTPETGQGRMGGRGPRR